MAAIEIPNHVFAFTWSVHNFSHCALKMRQFIVSPTFEVGFLKGTKYRLILFPRGHSDAGFVGVFLDKKKNCSTNTFVAFSVCKSNGIFVEKGACEIPASGTDWASGTGWGINKFLPIALLKGSSDYLNNDTMILRCQIWSDQGFPVSLINYAYTIIPVRRLEHIWKIKNVVESKCIFNETYDFPHLALKSPISKIVIFNGDDDDSIHISVHSLTDHETIFLGYTIHLIDANEEKAQLVIGQRLLEKSSAKQILHFPCLSKSRLLENKKLYLPNGTLTLRCEFSISTNDYKVRRVDYEINNTLLTLKELNEPDKTLWEDSMKRLCIAEEFSDIAVRSANKRFPVHKDVLSVHSDVFTAMLKHDMKEQNNGFIDIEDLEDDTVDNMLTYLYTGTVKDMDCSVAQKLFFAADKYEIKSLLKKCSNYLMSHLDSSNVCDVLVLADTHQDQELKQLATDYVVKHASEIFKSEKWNNMIETHAHLTSVTFQLFFGQQCSQK